MSADGRQVIAARTAAAACGVSRALSIALPLLVAGAALAAEPAAQSDFAVSDAATVQGALALAADAKGGRYLAAWTDNRNKTSELDIYGRILDPDGSPASPEFPIVAARGGQAFPAIAFDPGRGRFLVVWTDWRDAVAVDSDIYGRFVMADGTADGMPFPIARLRISQKFPAIAFDPAGNRYLVVWEDRRNGLHDALYGRFLAGDGRLLGPEFRIAPSQGDQRRPSVVFDENRGRFLVVWWARQDAAIKAAFVEGPRAPGGAPVTIADQDDPRPAAYAAAAFAPKEDRYLVVWTYANSRAKQSLDVHGILIDAETGMATGRLIPIATGAGRDQSAVVAYDPNAGRFLVVWLERRRNPEMADIRIHGRFVTADGQAGDSFLLSDPEAIGPKKSPALGFSGRENTFLVIWEDGRGDTKSGRRIYGRTR